MTSDGRKKLLLGKYEVLERIGSGGMAEVYKARTQGPGGFAKTLCLKRILPEFAQDASFIEMLVAEASVTSRLQHPNVAQVFDLEEECGEFYIVMELVEGCDFLQLLTHRARQKKRLDEDKVLYIMAQVGRGLDYAHHATDDEGEPLHIVHRDVSPSNILLDRHGSVKLVDFGVARSGQPATQDVQRKAGALKGKLGYMSPEMVTSQEPSKSSDIFALGIVLWEALTLRRLFLGANEVQTLLNVRDVRIEKKLERHDYISPEVIAVIRHALKARSEDRFTSAAEFSDALEDILFERRVRIGPSDIAALVRETETNEPISEAQSTHAMPRELSNRTRRKLQMDTQVDLPVPWTGPRTEVMAESPADQENASPWAVFTDEPKAKRDLSSYNITQATFRLRGKEMPEFGPVSYAGLVRMISSGSVTPSEEVRIDEADWQLVSRLDLTERGGFNQSKQPCIQEGPLNRIRLPQLIYECAIARISGTLIVQHGGVTKEIVWRNGLITDVRSNRKEELLGQVLVHHHGFEPEKVDMAIAQAERGGIRLGDALVELDLCSSSGLVRALEEQCRLRITDIFGWDDGWYELMTGMRPGHTSVGLVEDPLTLLVRSIRSTADETFLDLALGPFSSDRLVVKGNPRVDLARFRFEPAETAILQGLRSDMTLDEWRQAVESEVTEIHRFNQLVFLLHQADFISFERISSGA